MPAVPETKNEPPLEALVERLNELTGRLPRTGRLGSKADPASPMVADLAGLSQPADTAGRQVLAELMADLKRVEAAQMRGVAELRRAFTEAIGRLAPGQGAALSDDNIQKLRVALGAETRGNAERRILAELATIKASLADHAAKSIKMRSRSMVFLALGLGLLVFVAGLTAGVLMAPYLTSRLPTVLGAIFWAQS